MSRGYSDDLYPSWVTVTIKFVTLLVLIATLAYIGATVWGLTESVKDKLNDNHDSNSSTLPSPKSHPTAEIPTESSTTASTNDTTPTISKIPTNKLTTIEIVYLCCTSISVVAMILQAISTLNVLCHCHGNLKNRAYRWIIIQSIFLIVVILNYLIPFTFKDDGNHASAPDFIKETHGHIVNFWEKTNNIKDHLHMHEFWITLLFFVYFATVFSGCLIVGLVMACGARHGYRAVK